MLNVGAKNKTGPEGPKGQDGKDGASILSGSSAPGDGLGRVGDFFLNLTTGDLYEKSLGGWESKLNLIGPRGPKGRQGEKGEKGDNGKTGVFHMHGGSGGGDSVKGRIIPTYAEVSVAPDATLQIASFTVPPTKQFDVIEVRVNGGNIADWSVKIDGIVKVKQSTYFDEFDDTISLHRMELSSGQTISVEAKNLGATEENFNATIIGDQYPLV